MAFNAPLSLERVDSLIGRLAELGVESMVDLGCGRGAFARRAAKRLTGATIIGVDSDTTLVRDAQREAAAAGLGPRVRFDVGDAATWTGSVDAAVCIGASHAFDGSASMLDRVGHLVPQGSAVVGDGVWQSTPDAWCLDTFGELPADIDDLSTQAARAGWAVIDADLSTPAEWDRFEQTWIDGVRGVASPVASAFADRREAEYERYRGVLGFAWLLLRRQ